MLTTPPPPPQPRSIPVAAAAATGVLGASRHHYLLSVLPIPPLPRLPADAPMFTLGSCRRAPSYSGVAESTTASDASGCGLAASAANCVVAATTTRCVSTTLLLLSRETRSFYLRLKALEWLYRLCRPPPSSIFKSKELSGFRKKLSNGSIVDTTCTGPIQPRNNENNVLPGRSRMHALSTFKRRGHGAFDGSSQRPPTTLLDSHFKWTKLFCSIAARFAQIRRGFRESIPRNNTGRW